MDFAWIRLLVVAAFALLLLGCSEQLNDQALCRAPNTMTRLVNVGATAFVFVPAENFSASVEIVVPTEAVAGEWISLRAKRRSGPWKRVFVVLPPDEPWLSEQPPELESEVSRAVFWETDPPLSARCSFPVGDDTRSTQTAMFTKPGVYKIWAVSFLPWAKSNVVTVTVRSNK
jgi:hypothetical protein